MRDSKTGYFNIFLGALAYHFLLQYGCTYLVSVIACVNFNSISFALISLQKYGACSCVH